MHPFLFFVIIFSVKVIDLRVFQKTLKGTYHFSSEVVIMIYLI